MKNIVLLHGWGMNAAVFDELSQHLAREFRVYALDLPGCGGSETCEPYELDELARRISANAPARCQVVGWSLGAQVALSWARANDRQVETLTLLAATPCFVTREDWTAGVEPAALEDFERAVATDGRNTLRRFISLQAQGDEAHKRVVQKLRNAVEACALPAAGVLVEGLRILASSDLRDLLSAIRQRCLVVHGERDQLVPIAAAVDLARRLPRARLQVVPGAAHAPFVSDPRALSRLLAEHCR